MRALNRYVDLVQAKQRELETRFGIMMVQPGSADEADTPLQVRESYRPMFPSPRPIASREECDEMATRCRLILSAARKLRRASCSCAQGRVIKWLRFEMLVEAAASRPGICSCRMYLRSAGVAQW